MQEFSQAVVQTEAKMEGKKKKKRNQHHHSENIEFILKHPEMPGLSRAVQLQ